jgi:Holliday junction DNA helicase RuvB
MISSIFIDDDINQSFIGSNSIFKDVQDPNKPINDLALEFFSPVIGHDSIKRQLYRALRKEDSVQINILLGGASGTAKSLFMKIIRKKCNDVIFYDASAGSTGAGLIEVLRNNPNCRIIIIDEIAELKTNDLKTLRGLLNDGEVSKTLKSVLINFTIKNPKIFCTTNNLKKINQDKPLRSRFQIYLIKDYNKDEFIKVLLFCLKNQNIIKNEKLALELCYAMVKFDIRNVRTALSICSLVHEDTDKHVDIKQIIKDYITNNGADCYIDFNTEEI